MSRLSVIPVVLIALTGCSSHVTNVCEEIGGVVLQRNESELSFFEKHPEAIQFTSQPEEFRLYLESLGFSISQSNSFDWAFRCRLPEKQQIVRAEYAMKPPINNHQEGYVVGYDENDHVVAISNFYQYRSP